MHAPESAYKLMRLLLAFDAFTQYTHRVETLPVETQKMVPLAVGETVILLHSPLPSVGVSIWMERGCQQNDGLADG